MKLIVNAVIIILLATLSIGLSAKETAGQPIGIASVPNLRDLGGYKTSDGKTVARGLIYRSNQLSGTTRDDMMKLRALGLKVSLDLRTWDERSARPDELPSGTRFVWLDVLADSPQAGPAQLEKLMTDPKKANAELGGGNVETIFKESYRQFVSLGSAKAEFRRFFLLSWGQDATTRAVSLHDWEGPNGLGCSKFSVPAWCAQGHGL